MFFDKHKERLERAIDACHIREAWTPFIESPSRKHHPDGAKEAGLAGFEALLGQPFDLDLPALNGRVGAEVSPYTGESLGIDYPAVDPAGLMKAAAATMRGWQAAGPNVRVGICMEILDRLSQDLFRNAQATMHTAGQAFMMAFAGSGANSLDRGLEGVGFAHEAMSAVPPSAEFVRRFGRDPVTLQKKYRLVPRGVAVVVTCGSYPAWNAYPAILANLATGNPVVLKPHPNGVLPMAIAVKIAREVISDAGFDPNILTIAVDEPGAPITKALLHDPHTAIVDFTGSQSFGTWIEDNCPNALVYTETAGCNAVVVESTENLSAMLRAVAQGVALFSSQMCTAPQNIWVPADGIDTDEGHVSFEEFGARLAAATDDMLADPSHAAAICGAVHNPRTLQRVHEVQELLNDRRRVLRRSTSYEHPQYPNARTATPVLGMLEAVDRDVYGEEQFGPIAFVIKADDRSHALACAARDAADFGAIASYAYSTDDEFVEEIEQSFWHVGASVGINLVGHSPINFTAAFSDYHVTGLNPAGNACLTDLAFVTDRFRIVQSKREISQE